MLLTESSRLLIPLHDWTVNTDERNFSCSPYCLETWFNDTEILLLSFSHRAPTFSNPITLIDFFQLKANPCVRLRCFLPVNPNFPSKLPSFHHESFKMSMRWLSNIQQESEEAEIYHHRRSFHRIIVDDVKTFVDKLNESGIIICDC